MPKQRLTTPRERTGSVRVTVAPTERRLLPLFLRLTVIGLTAILASAGVVLGLRALDRPASTPQPITLDARVAASALPGGGAGPRSLRLALLGPQVVLDTRTGNRLQPGALAELALPTLPSGSTAVLLELSLLAATRPGAVLVRSGADEIAVLQVPRAGAMTTATAVVPTGQDAALQVQTDGGGHLLVQLLGAFEPAKDATSGRLVALPATRVVDLVPATDGKNATIDLAAVPALRESDGVAGVLLQMAADVGRRGGFVTVDGVPGGPNQTVFWMPTTGTDRTRTGFVLVPVSGGRVNLHYEAGSELHADLVGYVTGDLAPRDTDGLVVLVPPQARTAQARVGPGTPVNLTVMPPTGLEAVPADRVAAALMRVTATAGDVGGVTVYAPGSAVPGVPTVTAAPGAQRTTSTLVGVVDGMARVRTDAGASISFQAQALVLSGF